MKLDILNGFADKFNYYKLNLHLYPYMLYTTSVDDIKTIKGWDPRLTLGFINLLYAVEFEIGFNREIENKFIDIHPKEIIFDSLNEIPEEFVLTKEALSFWLGLYNKLENKIEPSLLDDLTQLFCLIYFNIKSQNKINNYDNFINKENKTFNLDLSGYEDVEFNFIKPLDIDPKNYTQEQFFDLSLATSIIPKN